MNPVKNLNRRIPLATPLAIPPPKTSVHRRLPLQATAAAAIAAAAIATAGRLHGILSTSATLARAKDLGLGVVRVGGLLPPACGAFAACPAAAS